MGTMPDGLRREIIQEACRKREDRHRVLLDLMRFPAEIRFDMIRDCLVRPLAGFEAMADTELCITAHKEGKREQNSERREGEEGASKEEGSGRWQVEGEGSREDDDGWETVATEESGGDACWSHHEDEHRKYLRVGGTGEGKKEGTSRQEPHTMTSEEEQTHLIDIDVPMAANYEEEKHDGAGRTLRGEDWKRVAQRRKKQVKITNFFKARDVREQEMQREGRSSEIRYGVNNKAGIKGLGRNDCGGTGGKKGQIATMRQEGIIKHRRKKQRWRRARTKPQRLGIATGIRTRRKTRQKRREHRYASSIGWTWRFGRGGKHVEERLQAGMMEELGLDPG